jgi:zinc transporter 1/2/3
MAALFLSVYIPGNIPFRSTKFRKNSKLLSLTSAFSGGLFIGVGLLHLLTESSEVFIQMTKTKIPYA